MKTVEYILIEPGTHVAHDKWMISLNFNGQGSKVKVIGKYGLGRNATLCIGPVCYSLLVPETRKFHRKWSSYFFCLVPACGCLVPRVAVWYRLSGRPFCSFTSVIMTS